MKVLRSINNFLLSDDVEEQVSDRPPHAVLSGKELHISLSLCSTVEALLWHFSIVHTDESEIPLSSV